MQSELDAAKEDLVRLRVQLNRAEDRIRRIEADEKRKRERYAQEGEDMVAPDWNIPGYAEYQLAGYKDDAVRIQKMINGIKNTIIEQRERRRMAQTREDERDAALQLTDLKKRLARKEEDLETVNRRMAQLKRRLGRINAQYVQHQMNNLYV